jgi:hypothetical protein
MKTIELTHGYVASPNNPSRESGKGESKMSWSVAAIGKAKAVRAEIAGQFARGGKCTEPEETIRQNAATVIDHALESTSEMFVVSVSASGSQGFKDYSKPENGVHNNLRITIEVQHGFVE